MTKDKVIVLNIDNLCKEPDITNDFRELLEMFKDADNRFCVMKCASAFHATDEQEKHFWERMQDLENKFVQLYASGITYLSNYKEYKEVLDFMVGYASASYDFGIIDDATYNGLLDYVLCDDLEGKALAVRKRCVEDKVAVMI